MDKKTRTSKKKATSPSGGDMKTGLRRSQVPDLDQVSAVPELQSHVLLTLDLTLFDTNPGQSHYLL